MIQVRAVHSQADAHRHALLASAGSMHSTHHGQKHLETAPTQRPAARNPVARGLTGRHTVAPRLGAWLIEFGTKLGGASVRTS